MAGVLGLGVFLPTHLFAEELVVYSGRKEAFIKPVLKAFEKETGIKILLEPGKTGGLSNRLVLEAKNPRADVFIATTAAAMETLKKKKILEPYLSPYAEKISSHFYHPKGYWTGITGRARIILYNKKHVDKKDIPQSVADLLDPKWKGKIAIASTREQTTLAWLSSLRVELGEEKAKEFITGLMDNDIVVLPDNTNVRRAVGKGEFVFGLTNSPNFYLQKASGDPVGVVYPNQKSKPGILVNPNCIALIRGGKNHVAAKKLVDFLLQKKAQRLLAKGAYEIPLLPGVDPGNVLGLNDFSWNSYDHEELSKLSRSTLKKYKKFSRVGS